MVSKETTRVNLIIHLILLLLHLYLGRIFVHLIIINGRGLS